MRVVGGLGAMVLSAWFIRTFLVQGLILPVRVQGGSMAPNLLGRHLVQSCSECGYTFPFDAIPELGTVCPNCGYVDRVNDVNRRASAVRGQRVLLDRLSLRLRHPRRWEVIAFRRPDGQLTVKRVVGLPGETVQIHTGDIWVDGQVVRKPLGILQSMLVPVHSDRYRRRSDDGQKQCRWRSNESRWQPTFDGYSIPISGSPLTFLTYHHLACLSPPMRQSETWPLDSYGFNQKISRSLQRVTDVVLECNVDWGGAAKRDITNRSETHGCESDDAIVFRFWSGEQLTEMAWHRNGQLVVTSNGEQPISFTTPTCQASRSAAVFVGFADGRTFFAVDGKTIMERAFDRVMRDTLSTREPRSEGIFAIGGRGLEWHVTDLRISRDMHYLRIHGKDDQWQLADNQFLLLGDNSPISEDARHGSFYGIVTADQVFGRLVPQFIKCGSETR